jgi:cytochrome P450
MQVHHQMITPIPVHKGDGWLGIPKGFLRNNPIFAHEMQKEYGNFFRFRLGPRHVFIISDINVIRHVLQTNAKNYPKSPAYNQLKLALGEGLVTSAGEHWKNQRKLIQPTFNKAQLALLFQDMLQTAQESIEQLKTKIVEQPIVDIAEEMTQITANIVMKTLFSNDYGMNNHQMYQKMLHAQEYVSHRINHPFSIPLLYLNGKHQAFKKDLKYFDQSVHQLIEQRKQLEEQPNDLLSMLLKATDEDSGQGMQNKQLRDEILTLYSAGHETSSNALSWTLYLLSLDKNPLQKILNEEKLILDDGKINLEKLFQLQYHKQVLEEAMRLYPPAYAIGRQALAKDEIIGTPIPKNAIMYVSIYALHRSETYWENPLEFYPERFHPEAVKKRDKLAYIPFGAGARMCVGNHFAMMEMQLLLALLVKTFHFELVEHHPVEIEPLITLKPKYGIKMKLSLRDKSN